MDVVLDPGEGDGSFSAALAEPEQEGPGTLVAQQSLLPLLADEAHDGAADRRPSASAAPLGRGCGPAHSPIVPLGQQVPLDHIQDPLHPQPEGEGPLSGALRWPAEETPAGQGEK